jgi:hypothetical protein
VRELGDSYATYHAYLASALEKVGRPKPEQYSSMDAYLEAWDWVQQLVRAEVILRNCRAHRATGRELNAPLEFDVALIGPGDRLLSVE